LKENKTSYKDIVIYTITVLLIMFLYGMKIINYNVLVIFLVIALATFALYNLRRQLSKLFSKQKR
jgi:hypothetical protein